MTVCLVPSSFIVSAIVLCAGRFLADWMLPPNHGRLFWTSNVRLKSACSVASWGSSLSLLMQEVVFCRSAQELSRSLCCVSVYYPWKKYEIIQARTGK